MLNGARSATIEHTSSDGDSFVLVLVSNRNNSMRTGIPLRLVSDVIVICVRLAVSAVTVICVRLAVSAAIVICVRLAVSAVIVICVRLAVSAVIVICVRLAVSDMIVIGVLTCEHNRYRNQFVVVVVVVLTLRKIYVSHFEIHTDAE